MNGRPTSSPKSEQMKTFELGKISSGWKSWLLNLAGRRSNPDYFLDHVTGVIHIGANLGQEGPTYARKNLKVLWVEPIPEIFERLVGNISGYPDQLAAQALLLDEDGKNVTLHIANNDGASSSILAFKDHQQIWPDVHYVDEISLQSRTLPSLLDDLGLPVSNYQALVMDTQGSELLIVKGATAILGGIKYIKTEVPDFEAYSGCPSLLEFTTFMRSLGFRLACKCAFASSPGHGTYFDVVYEKS
jgi:FkbM family methyltransferase